MLSLPTLKQLNLTISYKIHVNLINQKKAGLLAHISICKNYKKFSQCCFNVFLMLRVNSTNSCEKCRPWSAKPANKATFIGKLQFCADSGACNKII